MKTQPRAEHPSWFTSATQRIPLDMATAYDLEVGDEVLISFLPTIWVVQGKMNDQGIIPLECPETGERRDVWAAYLELGWPEGT